MLRALLLTLAISCNSLVSAEELTREDLAIIYNDAWAHYHALHHDSIMPPVAPAVQFLRVTPCKHMAVSEQRMVPEKCAYLAFTGLRGEPGFEQADILLDPEIATHRESPFARSIVYHEMIHYFQFFDAGATHALVLEQKLQGTFKIEPPFDCAGAKRREVEAYTLQAQRLEDAGQYQIADDVLQARAAMTNGACSKRM